MYILKLNEDEYHETILLIFTLLKNLIIILNESYLELLKTGHLDYNRRRIFFAPLILNLASAFPSGYNLTICILSPDTAAMKEI